MTPTPPPNLTPDADPRLLLPEWLRDESPADPTPSPRQTADTETSKPVQSPSWQQPPQPVDRYDPTGFITPDDLPGWIRELAASAAPGDEPLAVAASGSVDLAPAPSTTESRTEPTPAVLPSEASIGETDSPQVSDLTETRFVLLAGATLIIILAVLANFYL